MAVGSAGQSPFGGHQGRVLCVVFRPGGLFVATGGDDGTVRIWDVGSGEQRAPLIGHTGPVKSVAYNPDGSVIASAGDDRTVRIWDAGTGEQRAQLTGHTGPVQSVAYSPDGATIASAGDDRMVRIWNAATGEQARHLPRPSALNAVAFSPDGELIACAGGDLVWIWRTDADSEPRKLTGHTGKVNAVAFSPDGKLIASAGGDRSVRIWHTGTGRARSVFPTRPGTENAVAFSPDGEFVTSAGDMGKVLIWHLKTGNEVGEMEGHSATAAVNCVTYGLAEGATAIATASDDGTARVWDTASRSMRRELTGHTGPVKEVAYVLDGQAIATAGTDRTVRIWDARTGEQQKRLPHDGPVTAMTYSPRGARMVTVDNNKTVRIWDLADARELNRLETAHGNWVRAVAYKLDGSEFATASDDKTVLIWHADGQLGISLIGHTGPVSAVAYRPNGTVISGGHDGTVRVWDTDTGQPLAEFSGNFGEVWSVACSPEEHSDAIAAAGGDGAVLVWDVETRKQLARIDTHGGPVYAMAYDPAGSVIATASGDGTVKIWDASTFVLRLQLTGHISAVRSVAFSPDGATVATCGYDGTIRVWDARTGEQISGSGSVVPRARHLPLAGVSGDAPSTVDLIGVERDVDTLAELIAATKTRAPLAIAVIGEWGAGKSSIMELVAAQVGRIVDVSRNNRDATSFATSVCQIPFNAWHYSCDHLWAGVAHEMFRALEGYGGQDSGADTDSDPGKLRAEGAMLRVELAECRNTLKRLTSELNSAKSAEAPGGLLRSLGSPSYVARTFADAYREAFGDTRAAWRAVLIWLALAMIFVGLSFLFGPQVRIAIAAVVVVAGPLLPILTRLRSWHRMLIDQADVLYQGLERKKSDLEQRMTNLQRRLALADAQYRLGEFVRDRGKSAVYREGRGLIGDVHDDLLVLSDNLRQAHREWTAGDGQAEPPDRIVLYIDDLDRCPPDRVVEVLEAVHLILTLDLFIVVVAVDARWMIRSLESHYREFFSAANGAGTGTRDRPGGDSNRIAPYDYLDKIFQIPYTLVPPQYSQSASYLRSLLPEPRLATASKPPARAVGEGVGPAPPDTAPDGQASTHAARTRNPSPGEKAGRRPADHDEPFADPEEQTPGYRTVLDLQPPSLQLSHAEVEFMTRLGTLTPSPRAGKRMANLYRLVRISIRDDELAAFLGGANGEPYRAVQVLIAILTGAPETACELFERILRANEGDDLLDVLGVDNDHQDGSIADIGRQLKRLKEETGLPLKISEYQKWCPQLARYSFRTWRLARHLTSRKG
jgi:WD40 repeat protein